LPHSWVWFFCRVANGARPAKSRRPIHRHLQPHAAGGHAQANGQPRQALADYTQALAGLQKFQKIFPFWDSEIVAYRLNYLTDKVNSLAAQLPPLPQNGTPPATNAVSAVAPAATDAAAQLSVLRAQMRGLQSENEMLQAKLKEALQVQPATVDTQELARAQTQVLSLMKENDLLRASLTPVATNIAAPGELSKARQALADANQKLAKETARADKLAQENKTLQSAASANALEKAALEKRLQQRQTPAAAAPAKTSDEVKPCARGWRWMRRRPCPTRRRN